MKIKTKQIVRRLKEARSSYGWNQREAAKQYGIDYKSLNNYENGVRLPPPQVLISISEKTGFSIDYLLCRSNVKYPNTNLNSVCEYTGLTDDAVNNIIKISKRRDNKSQEDRLEKYTISVLSSILTSPYLQTFLTRIMQTILYDIKIKEEQGYGYQELNEARDVYGVLGYDEVDFALFKAEKVFDRIIEKILDEKKNIIIDEDDLDRLFEEFKVAPPSKTEKRKNVDLDLNDPDCEINLDNPEE